jgi:lipooligosaccharide transport system ATP-binding protein
MSGLALEARGLVKSFGDFKALNGVSFEVQPGECFGLLGPNGAGKSTTLKMVYGHIQPTNGELFVLGMNVKDAGREIRSRVGVVPQDEGLDNELTVLENLLIFSKYFGIEAQVAHGRALDLLKMMRLDEKLDERVENLSGGLRRRLAIARSLMNHPELMILDEPTVGLDPQVRIWMWNFLQKIKEQKKTIVLTTHYMEEAESLCDRLAIIDRGRVLAVGSPKQLIATHLGTEMVEFEAGVSEVGYFLNRLKEKKLRYFVVGDLVYVPFNDENSARELIGQIKSRRIALRKTNLSDVFLSLAGYDIKDQPGVET